jgi:hypothetical protein
MIFAFPDVLTSKCVAAAVPIRPLPPRIRKVVDLPFEGDGETGDTKAIVGSYSNRLATNMRL